MSVSLSAVGAWFSDSYGVDWPREEEERVDLRTGADGNAVGWEAWNELERVKGFPLALCVRQCA